MTLRCGGRRTPLTGTGFRCRTRDGVELVGAHLPGPTPGTGRAFVVGHGFTHGIDRPATRAVMAAFADHGGVVAVDFRGHGRSGGRSSAGRDEVLDLDAAVDRTRFLGYDPVTVVGFSLGAAVALRQAAIGGSPGDAVVSVSAPARWYIRETVRMRRVQWLLENPVGPLVGRALGVRLGSAWLDLPASPVEAVGRIHRPLLLIHGTNDGYFSPAQAIALHEASGAEMWIESGMGHGETATTPDLVDRIAAWSAGALRSESLRRSRLRH